MNECLAQWHRCDKLWRGAACLVLASGLLLDSPRAALAGSDQLEEAGDILQFALPISAMVGTFVADDPEGRWQYVQSFLASQLIMQPLKFVVAKQRPGNNNRDSFPSGHTTAAFSGASFLNERYGPWFGVPAYALAGLTGYSRVNADKHFVDDVIAGASIGVLSTLYFTSPYSEQVAVAPMAIDDGFGVQVRFGGSATTTGEAAKKPPKDPKFRFEFAFGPAYQQENKVTAPSNGGTTFDLDDFNGDSDPTTTAAISLQYRLDERQEILVAFAPYEGRDRGTFASPTNFDNVTYPAGAPLRSAFRLFDYRAQYSYDLSPYEGWGLRLGAGATIQQLEIELATDSGTLHNKVRDTAVVPYLYALGSYNITDELVAFVELDGTAVGDVDLFEGGAGLRYHFNSQWDLGASYQYAYREIDTSSVKNRYVFQGVTISVGYSF